MSFVSAPIANAPEVIALCNSLVPGQRPIYVRHLPMQGAKLRECFQTVEKHVELQGGEAIFGWNIVELKGIWLEAEFHAVWRSPNQSLADITPREFPLPHYLFLPEPKIKYEGRQVSNAYFPLTSHPAVLRHIHLAKEFFAETNRGDLAASSSYVMTPKIAGLQAEMSRLVEQFPWQL